MAQKKSSKSLSKKPKGESRLKTMFTHGSGGQLVVLLVIVLITVAFLIWTYSQGTLKQYLWLVILLVAMLVVQLLLFYRINKRK